MFSEEKVSPSGMEATLSAQYHLVTSFNRGVHDRINIDTSKLIQSRDGHWCI